MLVRKKDMTLVEINREDFISDYEFYIHIMFIRFGTRPTIINVVDKINYLVKV